MKNTMLLSLILLVLGFSSCNNTKMAEELVGKWKVTAWDILDSKTQTDPNMTFTFENGGRYEIDLNGTVQKGKYWVNDIYLHTVEDGKAEIKVKILDFSDTKMKLEMNRGGSLETLTLEKE